MQKREGSRKRSKLGSILILILVAAVIFVVMLGVFRLAGWVVRATFPEEDLNAGLRHQVEVIRGQARCPGDHRVLRSVGIPGRYSNRS